MHRQGWSRKFEQPIIIQPRAPRGKPRELVTLKDAGEYITKLPKAEHTATEWQTAMEALLLAVRGAPTMLARIGVMKALHRHELCEFKSSEKKTHQCPLFRGSPEVSDAGSKRRD
jgi:hypothetical protein